MKIEITQQVEANSDTVQKKKKIQEGPVYYESRAERAKPWLSAFKKFTSQSVLNR